VSDEMLEWKSEGTALYRQLPAALHASLRECAPLREAPKDRPAQPAGYETWKSRSKR